MEVCFFIFLVIFAVIFPPFAVLMIAGCGPDFLINIILTLLGYFPGHLHAFYIIGAYYYRQDQRLNGMYITSDAPGIFSRRVQRGGLP
ncbi:hypothetical protein BKA64DRAFT_660303 [Cadophora sp. MPI-SDFR-AT-0126]|nr:hypothetical protein BKA64DRAFT_660303 [Leotiomycetes sp. MPI-SDFR-AT-0126]